MYGQDTKTLPPARQSESAPQTESPSTHCNYLLLQLLEQDLPKSLAQAQEKIQWYRRRWGNEEWHRMLKSGCGAERREFTTAEHLQRALAFELILAWRMLLLVKLGRRVPDLPAEAIFAPDELEVLWRGAKKNSTDPCPV